MQKLEIRFDDSTDDVDWEDQPEEEEENLTLSCNEKQSQIGIDQSKRCEHDRLSHIKHDTEEANGGSRVVPNGMMNKLVSFMQCSIIILIIIMMGAGPFSLCMLTLKGLCTKLDTVLVGMNAGLALITEYILYDGSDMFTIIGTMMRIMNSINFGLNVVSVNSKLSNYKQLMRRIIEHGFGTSGQQPNFIHKIMFWMFITVVANAISFIGGKKVCTITPYHLPEKEPRVYQYNNITRF